MTYSKNYKTISILFNTSCLLQNSIIFNISNFYIWDMFSRVFVDTNELTQFLDVYQNENVTDCILDLDFEPIFQLLDCMVQQTNQIYYMQNGALVKKPDAWSIDYLNIDQDSSYQYDTTNKDKVELWSLDTGVYWKHQEFEPDQVIDVDPAFTISNITIAHGTGTAACSGGKNYGSSKGFKIYNYPVCRSGGGCGSSTIDAGFRYITNWLINNKDDQGNFKKRVVINLSVGIGMGADPTKTSLGLYYNEIFRVLNSYGSILVTSAGNSNEDACTWLYSFSPYVISVGALTQSYQKASFSNWGDCVDIWSFGSSVPTAYSFTDNYTIQYKSGTSFSSPLVAGLVANILSQNINFSRDQVLEALYYKINNMTVPNYQCGNTQLKCCQGPFRGTRKDTYCRSLGVNYCIRGCVIKNC